MSNINQRAFGAAIPADVVRKLNIAEEKGAGIGVLDSQAGMTDADLQEDSFNGNAHFSSKTPFARMWTAVSVVQEVDDGKEIDNAAGQAAAYGSLDVKSNRYEIIPGNSPKLKVTKIERTPTDALGKVYSLGTYNLRTGDRKIYESAAGDGFDPNTILASQRETYTDVDYAANPGKKRLRPPAGITSVRSSTRGGSNGPLQGVLKTSVDFTVYDFEEFDQIYSRYFLRPGAQIFVDFGWTHKKNFTLYDPEKLLQEEEKEPGKYMEKIYGKVNIDGTVEKNGQVHESDYDVQFVKGLVTNCRADLDPGSMAWNCSLDILSHNVALANPTLVEDTIVGNAKENILSNLDYRILVLAAQTLFPDTFGGSDGAFPTSNYTTNDVKLYGSIANEFGAEFLGNPDKNIPTQLNVELGIYWRGTYKEGDDGEKVPSKTPGAIYVSWGWFEDTILNKEFGKGGTFDVENFDLMGVSNNDDIVFKTSIDSRTYWSELLYKRQTYMGDGFRDLPFLFPDNWDDTYNTRKKDISSFYTGKTDMMKAGNMIPIREVFIKLDILKTAIRDADNLDEVFTYLSRKMADATGNNWKWEKQSSDPQNLTLGLVDVLANVRQTSDPQGNALSLAEQINSKTSPEFYKNLYTFNPGSPQSMIKNMSLNMSYGGSDMISSQVALSGLGSTGNSVLPVSDLIEQAQSMEIINNAGDRENINEGGTTSKYEVEFVPNFNTSDLKKMINANISKALGGNYNPDSNAVKDTSYLSTNIYGDSSFTGEQVNTSSEKLGALGTIIQKSSNIKQNNAKNLVKPSVANTDDYKKAKKELEDAGYSYTSNIFEYFTDTYIAENLVSKPTIMNFELNLQLYGINAFVIGDIFNMALLPKRIKNLVYFQIYNIEHSISVGDYTTTLGCKMLLRPDVKQLVFGNATAENGNVLEPASLSSDFKVAGIKKVLPFFVYVRPVLDTDGSGCDYILECKTFKGGKSGFIFELFESFDVSSTENFQKSQDYGINLTDSGVFNGPASLEIDETDKTAAYKKQYTFAADTQYFIFIKKNKWIITENKNVPTDYFEIFFPTPVEAAE